MTSFINNVCQTKKIPAVSDAVVIGAGLGGLYAHYKLRTLGLSIFGFEAARDVGGTWFWNRYPGARCDVESLDYSYTFSEELQKEWQWSERFATQGEILNYVNYVADRFDLRRDIAFEARVISAKFDEEATQWSVETNHGDKIRCRYLIATVGCLSLPKAPEIEGLGDFQGRWVQTAAWPHDSVDYAGKRIAVIGTGSSGMQAIPLLAEKAEHLTVFQRTANFSVPAHNGPIDPEHEARVKADYPAHVRMLKTTPGAQRAPLMTGMSAFEFSEEERNAKFEAAWQFGTFALQSTFWDVSATPEANAIAAEFVRKKIRQAVTNPEIAERLSPRGTPLGAKRLVFDTNYHTTFNRPNVELVDIRATPIERITAAGIKTTEREYPFDLIVFATGFDAVTGPLLALNIYGVGGLSLNEAWKDGPISYLGFMVSGFPNFFTVNGPGSPSVLVNMIYAIEHHVDLIADCISHMEKHGLQRIESEPEADAAWAEEVRLVANMTLYPTANSWYMGANVPGKPRVFLAYIAGFQAYHARCEKIFAEGFTGFRMTTGTEKFVADEVGSNGITNFAAIKDGSL